MIFMAFPLFAGSAVGHGARWVAVEKLGTSNAVGITIGWIVGLTTVYLTIGIWPANWIGTSGECYSKAPGAC